jgi:hypothetical protein
MSDQINDPLAEPPASGAEFSTDPTGATTSVSSRTGPDVDTVDTSSPMQQGAQQVGGQASQSAKDTAQTAKHEAQQVTSTATDQIRKLADQSRAELTDQASTQQTRLAGSLRDLGQQFGQMADSSDSSSMASQLARQASDQAQSIGSWLDSHEPGEVLDEVKRFARRKPGTFLAVAAGVGFLSGRLTRGLTAGSDSGQGAGDRYRSPSGVTGAYTDQTGTPRYESTTAYDPGTRTTTTTYGTTGTSTTGQTGQVSEASKPQAATAPGAPPGDVMGSAWEEGQR